MSAPWIPFLIAIGVVSVIRYRLLNRRPGRCWSSETGGGDVSYCSDGGGSSWSFGGSSPSSGGSGSSADTTGSWDSVGSDSGGGDSGGGGDGGGGGSGD